MSKSFIASPTILPVVPPIKKTGVNKPTGRGNVTHAIVAKNLKGRYKTSGVVSPKGAVWNM